MNIGNLILNHSFIVTASSIVTNASKSDLYAIKYSGLALLTRSKGPRAKGWAGTFSALWPQRLGKEGEVGVGLVWGADRLLWLTWHNFRRLPLSCFERTGWNSWLLFYNFLDEVESRNTMTEDGTKQLVFSELEDNKEKSIKQKVKFWPQDDDMLESLLLSDGGKHCSSGHPEWSRHEERLPHLSQRPGPHVLQRLLLGGSSQGEREKEETLMYKKLKQSLI